MAPAEPDGEGGPFDPSSVGDGGGRRDGFSEIVADRLDVFFLLNRRIFFCMCAFYLSLIVRFSFICVVIKDLLG